MDLFLFIANLSFFQCRIHSQFILHSLLFFVTRSCLTLFLSSLAKCHCILRSLRSCLAAIRSFLLPWFFFLLLRGDRSALRIRIIALWKLLLFELFLGLLHWLSILCHTSYQWITQ
eukprot:392300_1